MEGLIKQLNVFFSPKSVAIVGATKKINKAGHVILKNFIQNKKRGVFKGEIYPVNPHEDSILGFKCYPKLTAIPGELELAVIVVPAEAVPEIMGDAAAKGVRAVAIISSGFSEVGKRELEEKIVAIAKESNIRVLGPNCLGVYDSKTGVDMLFLPETKVLTTGEEVVATPRPMKGNIAMVTQSGAFGIAVLDYMTGRQMGLSKFVSFGNKCDVNEAEILHYLLHDEETKVIMMYIEDVKDGRMFMKVASEVTKKKPLITIKSGKTQAGARAASSHTGAMVGSDQVYEAVFKQTGILRARDMEEFLNMAKALSMQPPASGKNVAIITDAGGAGVMAADECESVGLVVKQFSEETLQKFEALKAEGKLPVFATNINPVDVTGSATSEMFEYATEIVLQDPEIHGVILLGLHHVPALQEDYIDRVARVAGNYYKPIVACDIGETEMALYTRSRFDKLGIPAYSSPEDAARAMGALVKYGLYLKKNRYLHEYLQSFFKEKQERLGAGGGI
ncbi:MAG: CoA-binding protein [Nitrososphaerota archaeon]|nr:CoA-binding protein [Candidatus Bathyarchaeota archaeon]MDW8024172.1 CoA-binding protein [Nitrososphaerota archaeon]